MGDLQKTDIADQPGVQERIFGGSADVSGKQGRTTAVLSPDHHPVIVRIGNARSFFRGQDTEHDAVILKMVSAGGEYHPDTGRPGGMYEILISIRRILPGGENQGTGGDRGQMPGAVFEKGLNSADMVSVCVRDKDSVDV